MTMGPGAGRILIRPAAWWLAAWWPASSGAVIRADPVRVQAGSRARSGNSLAAAGVGSDRRRGTERDEGEPETMSDGSGTSGSSATPPGSGRSRKALPWIIGGVVIVVLLVVGGPFLYINVFSEKAPERLSVSSGTGSGSGSSGSSTTKAAATGAAVPVSSLNGTWKVSAGSQAGYRVKETLVGQSTEAVGRTNDVTGEVVVADGKVPTATFTVDLTTVKSDKSQRDGQFQGRIMQTSQFPKATFTLTSPIDISGLPTDGSTGKVTATGDLTLHGVTKSVQIPLEATYDGTNIKVAGSLELTFADYGIGNPSAGPAQVGDTGTLEVLLVLGT